MSCVLGATVRSGEQSDGEIDWEANFFNGWKFQISWQWTTLGLSDWGSCEVSGGDSDRVVNNPAPLQQFTLCHHIEKSPQELGLKQKYYVYRVKSFQKLYCN